jgi:hypothetical protein
MSFDEYTSVWIPACKVFRGMTEWKWVVMEDMIDPTDKWDLDDGVLKPESIDILRQIGGPNGYAVVKAMIARHMHGPVNEVAALETEETAA